MGKLLRTLVRSFSPLEGMGVSNIVTNVTNVATRSEANKALVILFATFAMVLVIFIHFGCIRIIVTFVPKMIILIKCSRYTSKFIERWRYTARADFHENLCCVKIGAVKLRNL